MQVLDVGSGIGGPARYLAATFGCRVIGIDLSAEYCRIATSLTELVGLGEQVSFHAGDACNLPFPDASFDLVWTQHVVMNIADRPRLYAEMHRVLRPGGKLAMYDVVSGDGTPLQFPVPWARLPGNSFLLDPAATRAVLEASGFRIAQWLDVAGAAKEWLARPTVASPSPLGLHLLMGPGFAEMSRNYGQNLKAGRIGLVMAVAQA
jgi:ubiquinone/menaquinone biosynthesis C-methylase UbiE